MDNLSCVCVNIFNQLSQLLQTFQRHSTSSSSFSHTGGFGDSLPSGSQSLGNESRFNTDITGFIVMLILMAMLMFSNNR